MENYQIFISYRRDGGDALAGRLADRFNALGYKVFFDVESMRSGTFNTQILDALAQCSAVLLVLPPKALDRCTDEDDWVRQELAFALKANKKVIPILMRDFEFPKTLPSDIDKVRHMEGVTASSEYFDAVIDRIKNLLEFSPAEQSKDTKFPVYEDPEFSEEVIADIILYHLLKNPIPDDIKNRANKSLIRYFMLGEENDSYYGKTGVSGRHILHAIECDGKGYDIYDVFYKDGQKYAYGLQADIPPTDQQISAFFSIDESDNIKPILIGASNVSADIEPMTLFLWYTQYRRGLGGVPDALWPLIEYQIRNSFSLEDLRTYSDFIGLNNQDIDTVSHLEIDEIIEISKAMNENLLYPRVRGLYRGIGVWIGNGNCYGNRFQGRFADKVIKTPIRKKIVLDIVPTTIKNHYIALVYNKTKKKKLNYLLEGPEYYLITKKDGELDFCKISDDNLNFWCGKYFERFALIYMQVKLQIINAFFKK